MSLWLRITRTDARISELAHSAAKPLARDLHGLPDA